MQNAQVSQSMKNEHASVEELMLKTDLWFIEIAQHNTRA